METLILNLIPGLDSYPFLLKIIDILFALYFGGFIFSAFWGLLTGYKGYK